MYLVLSAVAVACVWFGRCARLLLHAHASADRATARPCVPLCRFLFALLRCFFFLLFCVDRARCCLSFCLPERLNACRAAYTRYTHAHVFMCRSGATLRIRAAMVVSSAWPCNYVLLRAPLSLHSCVGAIASKARYIRTFEHSCSFTVCSFCSLMFSQFSGNFVILLSEKCTSFSHQNVVSNER